MHNHTEPGGWTAGRETQKGRKLVTALTQYQHDSVENDLEKDKELAERNWHQVFLYNFFQLGVTSFLPKYRQLDRFSF